MPVGSFYNKVDCVACIFFFVVVVNDDITDSPGRRGTTSSVACTLHALIKDNVTCYRIKTEGIFDNRA